MPARKKSARPSDKFSSFELTSLSARAMTDLREAKKDLSQRFLPRAPAAQAARALSAVVSPDPANNVIAIGIGEELSGGKPTGICALKVFVRAKYPREQLSRKELLPEKHQGYEVDVDEIGVVRRLLAPMPNPRVQIRPAQPGCSIGFKDPQGQFVMAGTFGAVVKDNDGSYVLSNNHVLADENRLPVGSPIFQPGLLDDANAGQIAELTRFIPLQAGTPNKVDCAIARALKPSLLARDILYIGPPKGAAPAALDMLVHKFGRTTSYTAGRVTSIDTDVSIQYETGTYTFESQIIIVGLDGQPFSDSGDSGSVILDRQSQKVVGLLFAGSNTHTIANHIDDVLQTLNVTLA